MARKHFQRGSLFKRGKNRKVWVGRWWEDSLGENGNRLRVRRSEIIGSVEDMPSRRQAEQELARRMRAINSGNYSPQSARKFADFVQEDWMKVVLPTYKYATQKHYQYFLRVHLIPLFGELFLRDISRERIQAMLNTKLEQGLAWETVHHLQCALSKILGTATEWGYIQGNPVRMTKLPRRRRCQTKLVLTPEQVRGLLLVLPEPSRSLVFLLMVTGLRVGELLALRWRNVDLQRGFLRVAETVYEGRFDEPKSRSSQRVVPLGPRALAVLARRSASGPDALVFSSARGTPLDHRTLLRRQLKPAAMAVGSGNVNWHLLRHSNATLHDSIGTPLGTVQSLLGHSSSEITRQIYLHAIPEDKRTAVEKLEVALFGPKSDPNRESGKFALPEFTGAEEDAGRGDRI